MSTSKKTKKTFLSRLSNNFYKYLPFIGLAIFLVYRSGLVVNLVRDFPFTNTSATATREFMDYRCEADSIEHEHSEVSYSDYTVKSDLYAAKVARPVTAPNFVRNNDFKILGRNQAPAAFSTNTEAKDVAYTVLGENGQTFLRTEQQVDQTDNLSGSWLHDVVAVSETKTYGYSISYRSNVDSTIVIEFTHPDGSLSYEYVARLRPADSWKTYSGHFENSQFKGKSMRLVITPQAKGYVDTKDYSIYELASGKLNQGVISVTFDDGWESIYTKGRPLFKKYSIPTTQYIVSENSVNNVAGYMNMSEAKKLAKEGHEIGSHSLRHCNQTKLPVETVTYDADTSKRVLTEAGLNITGYAHPFGSYSDETVSVLRKNYSLIRSSDDGYNNRYFDPLNIRSKTIYNTTSQEEIQGWIQEARDNNLWLVLMYHRVDETGAYSVTSQQLEAQLQAVSGSGLPVMTVSQVAHSIQN